jgi:hypothetical protein
VKVADPRTPDYGYGGRGLTLTVNGTVYAVPVGALTRVIRDGYRREVGYVLDGDRVLAFVQSGQLDLTPELQKNVKRRYFTGRRLAGEQPTT